MDKNKTNEPIIQEDQQVVELDAETLMQMLGETEGSEQSENDKDFPIYFKEPLEFDDDELSKIVASEEYAEGMLIGAKLAGIYLTMVNLGVEERASREAMMNQQAMEHQKELQKIINDGSEKVAKVSSVNTEKQML